MDKKRRGKDQHRAASLAVRHKEKRGATIMPCPGFAELGCRPLAVAEIFDVDVGAEANVIGQVPAVVIGILVDDDLVGIPEPIVAIAYIRVSDVEIKAAKPEAPGTATGDAPNVAAAEAAGEVAMLPRMIEMEVRIIAA